MAADSGRTDELSELRTKVAKLTEINRALMQRVEHGLDLHGNVVHTLQDPSGETYPDTTSVIEHMGWLYIGSFSAHGVGRVRVPESRGGGTVPERGLLASSSSNNIMANAPASDAVRRDAWSRRR